MFLRYCFVHLLILIDNSCSIWVEEFKRSKDGFLWVCACLEIRILQNYNKSPFFKTYILLSNKALKDLQSLAVIPLSFSPKRVRKTVKFMGPFPSANIDSSSSSLTFSFPVQTQNSMFI